MDETQVCSAKGRGERTKIGSGKSQETCGYNYKISASILLQIKYFSASSRLSKLDKIQDRITLKVKS